MRVKFWSVWLFRAVARPQRARIENSISGELGCRSLYYESVGVGSIRGNPVV